MASPNKSSRLKEIDERKAVIEEKLKLAKANADRTLKFHEKLQVKLVGIVLVIMFVVTTSLTIWSSYMGSKSVHLTLEKSLVPAARVAADGVTQHLEMIKAEALAIGNNPIMNNGAVPEASRNKLFADFREKTGAIRSNGYSVDGYGQKGNITNKELIETVKNNSAYVTSPFYNNNGEFIFQIAVPVTNTYSLETDSNASTSIVGMLVFDFDAQVLTDLLSETYVGENGTAYMIDANGVTIASTYDYESVKNQEVTVNDPESDPNIIEAEHDMMAGNSGYMTYHDGVENCGLAYAPIEGTGWSIALDIVEADFTSQVKVTTALSFGFLAVSLILAGAFLAWYISSIIKPIINLSNVSKKMSEGDFNVRVDAKRATGEVKILADSFILTLQNTKATINDITRVMKSLEEKDFDVYTEAKYVGDYKTIETSIRKVRDNVSEALSQIQIIGEQVASGADQVSDGAQSLAQGATEQAASVEELSATVNDIYEQVRLNNENSRLAAEKVNTAGQDIEASNVQMNELMRAMEDITAKSNEISKIVKTIDDIAFQTNILALNAAVEAARAGAAGKGFAVVADEVRNLASKSAEAAKNTTSLIEQTTQAIAVGSDIANKTAIALREVVTTTEEAVSLVNQISEASEAQSSAISQVTMGIEQISAVVQTNSATAEQSAAASEELSGQARTLDALIKEFNIME